MAPPSQQRKVRTVAGESLLERDFQLDEIRAASLVAAQGAGRCLLIEAPAGAGKSALLQAGSEIATREGLRALPARGSELETEFAFGVVRQLLEPLVTEDLTARQRLLVGAAEPAARVISPETPSTMGSGPDMAAMLHGLFWLVSNAATATPLLLSVDDAHWSDPSSLRALAYLADRLPDLPVLLAVSFRPDEPGAAEPLLDALRGAPGARRLEALALSPGALERMVARRLPDAARNVVEAIHSATGGNPLLVEELLREVAAGGEGSGHDMISRVEEASVPLLGERVARRIAPAGERAPGLAAAAAVMGDSASLESIAALTGLTLDGAGSVAHRLRRMEVLSSEDPVTFVHPLVRRSVYDALPQQERRRLHARAAELLGERGADAQAVAAHLEVLSPAASPAAARGLVAAGDAALAAGAPDEALHWLRRALAEEAPEPPRASVLAKLGSAELMASEPASVSHLHEAFELTTEPRARTQVAVELAEAHLLAGDWGPAAQVARAARSALEGSGSELMAELAAIQALIKAYTPQLVGELDAERAAFAELTGGDSRSARSLAAVLAAVAAHRGEVARSRQLISRALEHDATLSGGSAATAAGAHLLIALTEVEDYERALDISHEMSAVARRRGRLNVVMVALDHRGWVQNRKGDLAAAEADLRTGTELAATTQSPTAAASRVFYCQDALLERPELEDLVEQTLAVELHEGLAQTWIGAAFLAARGRLRLERRDRAGAVADLRASNEMHVALRMGPAVSPSRSGLALALPASERDEAVALVDEEVRLAQDTGLARAQGVALRAAGLLADDGTGIESLSESVSRLEGSGASLDHARSLVELGAALRRAQRVSDARETLTAGLAQAEACGAERLARRTREELAASGIRRARVAVGGPMSLTASERRVAELASGGATNPEIAQDLFVTVKTVETHLSSAYAKLGIAGTGARERLPGALENPAAA